MWRSLTAYAVVLGLAVAVPVVRADDKDDDPTHPAVATKRVKDSKDHHDDAYAVTKGITTTGTTKRIHDEKHAQGKGYEAHAVMKEGKVGDVTVKDVKTGKGQKLRMVKSTKNPFKKAKQCGEEHIDLGGGDGDGDCNTQVGGLWYGWYYMNPYTNYYMYYWYPSTYVYYPYVQTVYPSIYDYTSYIVYY